MCNKLTFIGHVILRGTRIVIPKALRKRVVILAHEGHDHEGVVKTKERLKEQRSGGLLWIVMLRKGVQIVT